MKPDVLKLGHRLTYLHDSNTEQRFQVSNSVMKLINGKQQQRRNVQTQNTENAKSSSNLLFGKWKTTHQTKKNQMRNYDILTNAVKKV